MQNTVTAAEIKRRGMAAIEERLRRGPVHIIKRNTPAAVVISEEQYKQLVDAQMPVVQGMTAMQWLLAQRPGGNRERGEIDATLAAERSW